MADIVIDNYELKAGDYVTVQLPGSRKAWKMTGLDALTFDEMTGIAKGDLEIIKTLFIDEEARRLVGGLRRPQIEQLVQGFLGDNAGNSPASRG